MLKVVASCVVTLILVSNVSADTIDWKGQTWQINSPLTASAALVGGNLVLSKTDSSDATLKLTLPASINVSDTPWVSFSYIDSGVNNIDNFIDSQFPVTDPRLQAGSLFSYKLLGYTRRDPGATEQVEFATPGRAANVEHTILFAKEADGTVDYVFDGQLVTSTFLLDTTVGGNWGYGTDYLRLRGAAGSATFTNFSFGSDSAAAVAAATPLPAPAVAGLALLGITASGRKVRRFFKRPSQG